MDNNIKKQNAFISEEEKTLIWEDVQSAFKKILVTKFIIAGYSKFPWLKSIMTT